MVKEDSDTIVAAIQRGENVAIPPGFELLKRIQMQPDGKPSVTEVVVKKKPENGLAGDIVKSSMVMRGNLGEPQISFTLTDDARRNLVR